MWKPLERFISRVTGWRPPCRSNLDSYSLALFPLLVDLYEAGDDLLRYRHQPYPLSPQCSELRRLYKAVDAVDRMLRRSPEPTISDAVQHASARIAEEAVAAFECRCQCDRPRKHHIEAVREGVLSRATLELHVLQSIREEASDVPH